MTDYYEVLNLTKKASHTEIKQSYKQLALKFHPDKNQDKEMAKIKFHQISEAYTVLNDPKKREKYDLYGMRQNQMGDFEQFQQFQQYMSDFNMFEQFIDQVLSFDQMEKMFSSMFKTKGKKGKKGRNKRSKKAGMGNLGGMFNLGDLNSMMEGAFTQSLFGLPDIGQMSEQQLSALLQDKQFLQAMREQGLQKQQIEEMARMMANQGNKNKKSNKKVNEEELQEDQEDLTEQELKILQFGKMNCVLKKNKKKKKVNHCKFDDQKIKQQQILLHFSQHHMKQFQEWRANGYKINTQQQKIQKNQQLNTAQKSQ